MRLVLFDIDGTLISDHGAARDAFGDSLANVYGFEGDLSRYDFSGRTDPHIAGMVLRDAGFDAAEIEERMERLWEGYLRNLERNATPERVRVLPGIRPLLEALEEHPEVILGLLTGNIEAGARVKLNAPRLNSYFPFGAFGSDSADRTQLPPVAVRRAAEYSGIDFNTADVVIIGDSIHDIRCGVPWDATTIAIASGKTAAEILRAENPKHFFESAEDLDGLLNAILSAEPSGETPRGGRRDACPPKTSDGS